MQARCARNSSRVAPAARWRSRRNSRTSRTLPHIVDKCTSRFGRLDALVNNASAFFPTPIGTVTAAQWDDLFTEQRARAAVPGAGRRSCAAARRAARSSISSTSTRNGRCPGIAVYCMAKAALAMMTLALAQGTRRPRSASTAWRRCRALAGVGKAYADQTELIARTPLQRTGAPEDVAGAVLFLLARCQRSTTGQILRASTAAVRWRI